MVKPTNTAFPLPHHMQPSHCCARDLHSECYEATAVLSIEQSTKQRDQSTHRPDFIDGHTMLSPLTLSIKKIFTTQV